MRLCWNTSIEIGVNLTRFLSRPLDLLFLFHLPFSGLQIDIKPSEVPQPGRWRAIDRGVATLPQVSQLLLMYLLLSSKEVRVHGLLVEVRRLLWGTVLALDRLLRLTVLHHP